MTILWEFDEYILNKLVPMGRGPGSALPRFAKVEFRDRGLQGLGFSLPPHLFVLKEGRLQGFRIAKIA